jgi:hypothetical protein
MCSKIIKYFYYYNLKMDLYREMSALTNLFYISVNLIMWRHEKQFLMLITGK